MWTKESLQEFIKEKMSDYLFIIVSNRQPYIHKFKDGRIEYFRGAGGVITALDPVMQVCDGIWVAHGNGEADSKVADERGMLRVPPKNSRYTLKRVWLTKEEESGYYYGYSNEALWPLCHQVFQRPNFRHEDWEYYCRVNKKFAEAILQEVGDKKAFVWVQDYHLTLLPKYLKEAAGSQLIIAHFWHIPWPNYEAFRICPQKKEILEGLLSNNLLGFHIRHHCDNFLSAVDWEIESKIDHERFSVIHGGHETLVRPYPISVDFEGINQLSDSSEVKDAVENLRQKYSLSGMKILFGLDRFDYTKGISERLLAIDRLLEKHPELKKKIVFLQMGPLSRIRIPEYKAFNEEIDVLVEKINRKHFIDGWRPILLVRGYLTYIETQALYRLGDLCIVSSLHDGMNMVAKEFISTRSDCSGMLILSQFTGAARELSDAVLVNPYDREEFSEKIYEALNLSKKESKKRMKKMRQIIQQNNIYRWAGKVLSELLKFEFEE